MTAVTFNQKSMQVNLLGSFEETVVFNGAVYPFDTTYKWSEMNYKDWKTDLNTVEANYNINDIKKSMFPFDRNTYIKSLGKTDADSSEYWNTYLVPWAFPYNLDDPYVGSHPGMDIRNVKDAPVFSISNGIVEKVKDSDGTVCIKIPNVKYENNVQDLYACYLHMDFRTVSEGDVVKIGQQIGGVGDKGFATTPHLHLQIDRADAPWHPYWPFSTKEASDAGLGFVEAVNAGLGLENLKKYTIDPMDFIQNNLVDAPYILADKQNNNTNNQETITLTNTDTIDTETTNNEIKNDTQTIDIVIDNTNQQNDQNTNDIIETTDTEEINNINDVKSLQISTTDYYPNKEQELKICAIDGNGELTERTPTNEIFIELEQGEGTFSKNKIKRQNFEQGCAKINFTPSEKNTGLITFYAHDPIHLIKGSLEINKFEFKDVNKSSKEYKAIEYAFVNGITTGYPDGTFRPENDVKRVEAVAFILRTLDLNPIADPNFDLPDANDKEWYAGLLAKAMEEGMIQGYPDGTVKLENTVNGAEYLKIFLTAFADIQNENTNSEWYQKFLDYAEQNKLVDENFDPSKSLNRGQVVDIIYKAKGLL
ncbi:hypothetical protein A2272_02235 [Candidatus Peregrinibacteria bacterium RIFOXYA12_FULL_33_12]|nr:MAG: hypothetical protein A2263_03130 [Candidatus Peregrinibacteria bacterium RIFOXYA2_FULL_33_21]OGJ45281.1 MAG: hypothetical protein A2272_02235 [Candidatus Peregrinibacteria bacterium RIFOXYA12_FULL_33_12]OGJ50654.1 MAG: hypothetical protein A2307_03420 [Candidatus Peregrinibacteria bacterium RIFOXYB2_FULL_33_20]